MQIRTGEKIKNFRKRAGMSQLGLEVEIDASAGSISRIENGDVNPTKETLFKIAEALKLNGSETASLFGLETQKEQSHAANPFNIKQILDLTTSKWVSVLGVSYAVVFLWNENKRSLKVTSITIPYSSTLIFEKIVGNKIENIILFMDNPLHAENHYLKSIVKKEILVTSSVEDFARPLVPPSLYQTVVTMLGMKKAITIPLITQDKVLGVLGLIWPKDEFTEQDKLMVDTFAEQVSITIYNSPER